VQDDGGLQVQHVLQLQPDDGYVQGRDDERWLRHDLHERRRQVLRNDPGLLRLHERLHKGRLHLLHDDERLPGLLLHVLIFI